MAQIKQLERKTISLTTKQLNAKIENGTALFDNAVQRSTGVWSKEQMSLLIHTLIINAPVPPFYAVKNSEGCYDFLDGKQRSHAIHLFLNNGFELSGVPIVEYDNGEEVDINGMIFDDLPEDMQDEVRTYSLNIVSMEDLDEDQEGEVFYRLNNGKALSKIEQMRAICPSIKKVQDIAQHPIFELATTEKSRQRYVDEDLVIKSLAMLHMETPCLDVKAIRPYGETLEISEDEADELKEIYDRLMNIYQTTENPKAAKHYLGRTHFVTLVRFIKNHENDSDPQMREFLEQFFDGGRTATVNPDYNLNAGSGAGHSANIKARLDILNEEYEKFQQ